MDNLKRINEQVKKIDTDILSKIEILEKLDSNLNVKKDEK